MENIAVQEKSSTKCICIECDKKLLSIVIVQIVKSAQNLVFLLKLDSILESHFMIKHVTKKLALCKINIKFSIYFNIKLY